MQTTRLHEQRDALRRLQRLVIVTFTCVIIFTASVYSFYKVSKNITLNWALLISAMCLLELPMFLYVYYVNYTSFSEDLKGTDISRL